MNDISRLALHLRDNGESILNANEKLTLTTPLLQSLNESFTLIVENQDESNSTSFQVINTNNSKIEIFHDLAFLHDFLQMTRGLKLVSHESQLDKFPVLINVNKFKVLNSLEVKKVPLEELSGIQDFRSQLQSIVCRYCLRNLESLLVFCGADQSAGYAWSMLREADFSYNRLDSLDYSLNYTPWLQILDVSHNRITDAKAVICLPNLTDLNLSYNLLESMPALHKSAVLKLKKLVIKYNHVEDLTELSSMQHLTHLDVSYNCLLDHSALQSLLHLPMLIWLNLKGNPLSFLKQHRLRTAQFLNKNTSANKFLLDLVSLSKSERLLVGKPTSPRSNSFSQQISTAGISSASVNIREISSSHDVETPPRLQSSKRVGKVREAIISELDEIDVSEPEVNDMTSSLELSSDHLETKKKIELLREQFGEEDWLRSRGGTCVQDVLGLPHSYRSTLSSTPPSKMQSEVQANLIHHAIISSMPPVCSTPVPSMSGEHESQPEISITEDISSITGSEPGEMETSTDSMFGPRNLSSEVLEQDQIQDEDDEGEKQIYLVERANNLGEGIFLVVTEKYIKEKEAACGKTLDQWTLDSLMSAIRISNVPVHVLLSFRTVRRDRQERTYVMEDKDAQELITTLSQVLATQIFSFMKSFCCIKCSTQFSLEESDANFQVSKKNKACPTCQSTYVIEMDEVPSPKPEPKRTNEKPVIESASNGIVHSTEMAQSPSQSSIGTSGSSQLQVTAIIHHSETPRGLESTHNNSRSAASLDPSPEGFPASGGTMPGRSDSDVEVISNPSQSSIEVLEDSRREVKTPPLPVASARSQLLSLVGLTESSSSGSLTDSVCTTYENHVFSPVTNQDYNHHDLNATIPITEASDSSDFTDQASEILPENWTAVLEDIHNSNFKLSPMSLAIINTESFKTDSCDYSNRVQYNFSDYAQVDHRVKLHLYHQVFKDKNEELLLLVRAYVVPMTTTPYPGCIVFSNCSVYLLQVGGFEGDDPCLWLVTREVVALPRVKGIQVLPWYQGFCLEFRESEASVLVLLQDVRHTLNLFHFLKNISLPEKCVVASTLSSKHKTALQQLYINTQSSEKPTPLQHLSVFTSSKVSDGCGVTQHNLTFGFFFITDTVLILTKGNLHWLFPQSSSKLEVAQVQSMSNLMQVQLCKQNLVLEFLNETQSLSSEEIWVVELKTIETLQKAVETIKQSWEELFAVPLQVTETLEIPSEI